MRLADLYGDPLKGRLLLKDRRLHRLWIRAIHEALLDSHRLLLVLLG